jgi:hypothetical protein
MSRLSLLLLAASIVWLGSASSAFAQKGKVSNESEFRRAQMQKSAKPKEEDGPLSPAKQKARERVKQAEQQYVAIDAVIAAYENRIRAVRSIRVPPGVRPPQIDPVPVELLQRRAQAWNVLQQAIRAYKQTP